MVILMLLQLQHHILQGAGPPRPLQHNPEDDRQASFD